MALAGLAFPSAASAEGADNSLCLACHGMEGFAMPGPDGQPRSLHVIRDRFESSVHGQQSCVGCHKDITGIPHETGGRIKVGCVQCHEDLWAQAQQEQRAEESARLGHVKQMIDRYMHSIHARPNREDQSRTNATCYDCHDAHYVYPAGSEIRAEWRLDIPNTCGKCHAGPLQAYAGSVHGREVLLNANPAAAICSDCHTTHDVESPAIDSTKLAITRNCGNCHEDSLRSYTRTYHGKVNVLGYAYTAKCFDCHGSHGIQRTSDPASTVHPDNRLQTCRGCHERATAGFVTFEPHATTDDFERYPYMWIASKFMGSLIIGVFLFFWTHSALWFYREYKDRQARKDRPHVRTAELPQFAGKQIRRFGLGWRLVHLFFALALMILSLTGMAAFYAETAWAAAVMQALGGPQVAAIIHRVAAVVILGLFVGHVLYFAVHFAPRWRTFNWFGHTSLVPSLQDLRDIVAMFKWFFGRAPRPVFGRWTYWERFDYWAPFWGLTIVGGSGLMLWFKEWTASFLPGWVFNIASLAHGEEAFLAILFLFTVHFFNNHFRPDKLPPPDVVMFTGSMPLEEFRREHRLEYDELVATGQLEKHLVDEPSRAMTRGSKILGVVLLAFGLTLLALVLAGFLGSLGRS
ncbi:MAG: cytochrome b/b6 domain-containing protein [Steroidobacteraceae bacterium]|nr:cytochrome b/b6 domain-containing protein [Steroidobacteraceae bacterium]